MNISSMGFFSEYKLVNQLIREKHAVVFYAESRHYFTYFEELINELLRCNVRIIYITSDKTDPLLTRQNDLLQVFHIKWMLGFLFKKINAKCMIMTMPDLDNFLFKRSPGVDQYIYMFHAAVSTHQQ